MNLFLDDIRHPFDAFRHTQETMFLQWEWVVVKNYTEFVNWIRWNGLPDFIAFDHDLAVMHYTSPEYWSDYEKSKAWQDAQTHTEKTGLDCAKWLVEYCMSVGKPLPPYYCHSQNPVGKDNILGYLNGYRKHSET